jgi:hypothetical protein
MRWLLVFLLACQVSHKPRRRKPRLAAPRVIKGTAMGMWALRWLCARVWALRMRTGGKVQRGTLR